MVNLAAGKTGRKVEKNTNRSIKNMQMSVFSRKFKKKSCFSLNSGNFYVTLQLELCPDGSLCPGI